MPFLFERAADFDARYAALPPLSPLRWLLMPFADDAGWPRHADMRAALIAAMPPPDCFAFDAATPPTPLLSLIIASYDFRFIFAAFHTLRFSLRRLAP